ncbi:MAG: PilZ domain-containing protein [Candidatus Sulfotelmatobacter sp.]
MKIRHLAAFASTPPDSARPSPELAFVLSEIDRRLRVLATKMLKTSGYTRGRGLGVGMRRIIPTAERRRWPRLPLAIPVFVRSEAEADKQFLEFATALNVSAGGMLVAVRRSIPPAAQVSLEIPSAPVAALAELPNVTRNLRARVLRTKPGEGYHLVGLKFSRPLAPSRIKAKTRRKLVSAV